MVELRMEPIDPNDIDYTSPNNIHRLSTYLMSVLHPPPPRMSINKSRNVLLNLATKEDISWLSERERVLCQSVLIDIDETGDELQPFRRETMKESSAKVCFRCLYCEDSPLVAPNAEFSFAKTIPACIESLGDTLELMSKRHFQVQGKCMLMPDSCRSVFEKINEEDEATKNGLQEFCKNVAYRYKFVNNHPYKTGITSSDLFQSPSASVGQDNFPERKKTVHNPSSVAQGLQTTLPYNTMIPTYADPYGCHPSYYNYDPPIFCDQTDVSHPSIRSSHSLYTNENLKSHKYASTLKKGHIDQKSTSDMQNLAGVSYSPTRSSYLHHTHDHPNSHEYPSTLTNRFIAQKSMIDSHNSVRGLLPQFTSRSAGDNQRINRNASNPVALENCRTTRVEKSDPDDVVFEEDRLLLTDYFFAVNKELKLCHFTETDRKSRGGNRNHIAFGYGGLQCRHCAGEGMASRKFFWSSVDRLANSFAEILIHMNKCSKVPNEVKEALAEMKALHPQQMKALPRGSQKVFFRRVWRRMHNKESQKPEHDGLKSEAKIASNIFAREEIQPIANLNDSHSAASPRKNKRTLLAIREDKAWLSDFDCFVRRNIEVFCASEEDVADTMDNDSSACHKLRSTINSGRVGIRCVHCAAAFSSMKSTKSKKVAITFYPPTISDIYESVQHIKRIHLVECPHLSTEDKTLWSSFQDSASSLTSILRRYYILAGSALGMRDTSNGISTKKGHLDPKICLYFENNMYNSTDVNRPEKVIGDILLEHQNLAPCLRGEKESSNVTKRTYLDPNTCLNFESSSNDNADSSKSEKVPRYVGLERQNLSPRSSEEKRSHKRRRTDYKAAKGDL